MSDIVVDPKEEKKDKPLGLEVRDKSFQQLLKEQQEERNKSSETVEETEEQKAEKIKLEEEKKTKEIEEAKAKEEADRKLEEDKQNEIARKAAEEVTKKQDEDKKVAEDKLKAEEEEKKRQEALKPAWQTDPNAKKDDKGNPLPQSYDQIADEAARIAEEKAFARLQAAQQEKEAKDAQAIAEKTQNEETIKAQQKAASDQLQKELDADLTDLYTGGKLPRIVNKDDPNDPGLKEERNLFKTAQKVNADRMAKGLPVIRSLKLIYYEHYKPLAKPAGHDAPVLGSEDPKTKEAPEDKYIVSRDRNKSYTQLFKEEAQRLGKKIGIRGK